MFDFARNVLGKTYVIVFIACFFLWGILVGQVIQHYKVLGILLLLGGCIVSMYVASVAKIQLEAVIKKYINRDQYRK